MGHIVYSDTEKETGARHGMVDYYKLDATKHYLRHYNNHLYLAFIQANSDDPIEKIQVSKELVICNRKLEYWENHPNYDRDEAIKGIETLKKQWSGKR